MALGRPLVSFKWFALCQFRLNYQTTEIEPVRRYVVAACPNRTKWSSSAQQSLVSLTMNTGLSGRPPRIMIHKRFKLLDDNPCGTSHIADAE
jgi:hypothetical protein